MHIYVDKKKHLKNNKMKIKYLNNKIAQFIISIFKWNLRNVLFFSQESENFPKIFLIDQQINSIRFVRKVFFEYLLDEEMKHSKALKFP